jgi:hypothetical protein
MVAIIIILISSYSFAENKSEFEGKYQVGNVTCTVKPIKMAFEVRWTKGKGVMIFFFDRKTKDGKYIFVSGEEDAIHDRFEFDNNQFIFGKFIRSDGKAFQVKKIYK